MRDFSENPGFLFLYIYPKCWSWVGLPEHHTSLLFPAVATVPLALGLEAALPWRETLCCGLNWPMWPNSTHRPKGDGDAAVLQLLRD